MINVPYVSPGQERPPFVRFEEQEVGINYEASEKAGRPVPRFRIMACITSFGSKDEHVKDAEEWLNQIRQRAVKGEYNPEWAQRFRFQFDEYQKGNELPREGTPMQTCPMYSKDQIARARAINITTVEDLGQLPDSGLSMLGLDARHMRDSARAWLSEAKDKGVVSRQIADQNVKLDALEAENASLRERLAALEKKTTKAA